MSSSANTFFYWINNANSNVADNEAEASRCMANARKWAMAIIAGND